MRIVAAFCLCLSTIALPAHAAGGKIAVVAAENFYGDIARQIGGDRVEVVLNRADSSLGVRSSDAEQSIGRRIAHTVVSDGRSVVTALNREVVRIIQLPEVKTRWETLGAEAMPLTPEEFDKYLSEQSQLVAKLVKAADIQVK